MELESNGPARNQTRIQVFVCHSRQDADLAAKVVELLISGIDISNDAIRCTSVPENELDLGDPVPDELRRNLQECSVVIALLTPASLASHYVLMELGATWGLDKTACLLLARGLTLEHLPGPLNFRHALQLGDRHAMPRLLKRVASSTGLCLRANRPEASAGHAGLTEQAIRLPRWRPRLRRALPSGLLAALAAGIFAYAVWSSSHAPYSIHLLTGNAGGRFYELGTWLKDKMEAQGDAAPSLETTGGSVDNCDRIEQSEANAVALAWTSRQCGETREHPERKARVVAVLYPEVLHFLVHKDADTPGSLPDLRSKKVYFGNERSGTRSSAKLLLSKAGYEDTEIETLVSSNCKISELSFDVAAKLLQRGELGAAFFGTGLGATAVHVALEKGSVRLVALPLDLIQRMTLDKTASHFEYASLEKDEQLKAAYEPNSYRLSSAGYRESNEAAKTSSFKFDSIASDVVLLATESVEKQFVEQLLRTLYDPANQQALESYGVSRTYLEHRTLLNQRMTEQGILLNTSVDDYQGCWFSLTYRRALWFSAGVLAVFVFVTVVGAAVNLAPPLKRREHA